MPASRSESTPPEASAARSIRARISSAARWNSLSFMGAGACATLHGMIRALAWIALAAALGACGQKGPLKLPEPPKAASHASP